MTECAICLKPEIDEADRCINDCGHEFCKSCIDTWFDRGHNSCPLCRQLINYFRHNEDNYRVIIKQIRTPRSPAIGRRPQGQQPVSFVTIHKGTYNFFRYVGLGILLMLFLQGYLLVRTRNRYYALSNSYDECLRNTSVLSRYIQKHPQNDYVNMLPIEEVYVYNKYTDEYVRCSIPNYYMDSCFS
jgi:hypothetical protein